MSGPLREGRPEPALLRLGSFNLQNLCRPGRQLYPDFEPLDEGQHGRKMQRLTDIIRRADAQVLGVQELGDAESLGDLAAALGGSYPHLAQSEPGEESPVRVGLLSRLPILERELLRDFPRGCTLRLSPRGTPVARSFSRPVLRLRLELPDGGDFSLYVLHLKSRRPLLLEGEDPEDADAVARGQARSLLQRAAEALALRLVVNRELRRRDPPRLAILGDFNDGPDAPSSQILRSPGSGGLRDPELRRNLALVAAAQQHERRGGPRPHSHVWGGQVELLDQVLLSASWFHARRGQPPPARLRRFAVLNDHLYEPLPWSERRCSSDHGLAFAELELPQPGPLAPPAPAAPAPDPGAAAGGGRA